MNRNQLAILISTLIATATTDFLWAVPKKPSTKPSLNAAHSKPVSQPAPSSENPFNSSDFNKEPTYVRADSLLLKSEERYFIYTGSVEVKHADMTLTSASLEGHYDENNKIQSMLAKNDVVIVKGDSIRGTGNDAKYDAATECVTLSDGPEVTQNGSVLAADVIRIFLKENRSEASGQVRVKMINKDEAIKLKP